MEKSQFYRLLELEKHEKIFIHKKFGRQKSQNALKSRDAEAKNFTEQNKNKITAKFSHYGDAESFWDQRIAESGTHEQKQIETAEGKSVSRVVYFDE